MYNSRQVTINLTIAALLCLVIFSYLNFLEYRHSSRGVEHTYEVLNSITKLEAALMRLQVLRRGYMLSTSDVNPEQIQAVQKQVHHNLDTLTLMINDNKLQINHVNHITKCLDSSGIYDNEWLSVLPDQDDQSHASNKLINLDKVYEHLSQMKQIESELMGIRAFSKKESEWLLPVLILITGATAISMLFYTFFMMNKELKQRLITSRALESNVKQLNLTNEELERFAFIASHNLKEPIRKARTTLSRIQLGNDGSPEQIAVKISKSDNLLLQLQHLLDDLLIYTKLLNHHENKERVSLEAIFQKVVQEFTEEVNGCGASISVGSLPEVSGFPMQMSLVFRHLMSNAIKYRKTTEPLKIKVSSHLNTNSNHLVIDFEDNGIGFDTRYLQKIFEVFGRLHPRDEYEGTGIGLAICRRVMSNHDGFIHANSEPGRGAKFSLYFPVRTVS